MRRLSSGCVAEDYMRACMYVLRGCVDVFTCAHAPPQASVVNGSWWGIGSCSPPTNAQAIAGLSLAVQLQDGSPQRRKRRIEPHSLQDSTKEKGSYLHLINLLIANAHVRLYRRRPDF